MGKRRMFASFVGLAIAVLGVPETPSAAAHVGVTLTATSLAGTITYGQSVTYTEKVGGGHRVGDVTFSGASVISGYGEMALPQFGRSPAKPCPQA